MVKKYDDDIDYSKRYLTFEAIENGVFSFYKRGGSGTIQYSLDNGDTWCVLEDYHNIYLLAGQCVWWKGNLRGNIKSVDDYKPEKVTTNHIDGGLNIGIGRFVSTGKYNAMGNIMSLLYEDDFIGKTDMLYPCMFAGTFAGAMGPTQLTHFPEGNCIVDASNLYLPAKKITGGGYYGMFASCKYLTKAPRILATEVSYACCYAMFMRCDSLTTTPILYSKTLIPCCYLSMFYECPNVHNIVMLATDVMKDKISEDNGITTDSIEDLTAIALSMIVDRNSTGIMSLNSNSNISNYINSALPTGWTTDIYSGETKPLKKWFDGIERNYSYLWPLFEKQYLTFEALTESSFSFSTNNIDYSLDGGSTWATLTAGSSTPTIAAGSKVMWKATNPSISLSTGIGTFSSTGYYNVEGNIMSLLYGDDFIEKFDLKNFNYVFYRLFYNSTKLIDASNLILPATTLTTSCYSYMFADCESLITAPELPATTLADNCYYYMFAYCTALKTAPEKLPATTLANSCYYYMFSGCDSLTTTPELPATTLANSCYMYMFLNCASLTSAPELPATTLADGCYHGMFYSCDSLTSTPELPATNLVEKCYYYMFSGCSKLNNIVMLATDISASNCLSYWVDGVASTGTFIKHFSMTTLPTGVNGTPSGWVVKDNVTITKCNNLEITADDVNGRVTTTTIYYRATCDAVINAGQNIGKNTTVQIEGSSISAEFPQNTSTTNTVTRTITFEYMGVTATTTITQGVWVNAAYVVNLNNQWQVSSKPNPDSNTYEGVYESFSNYNVNNSAAAMYIDISGYNTFKLYIRSYAESNYDYVMVSQLDTTIAYSTSYSDTTLVKAHTRGSQNSGTSIGSYKLVEFTNIDGGNHRIMIIYRKDSSANSNDDRGYVLIPKNQQ